MTRKERFDYILQYFAQKEGHVTTELQFASAFQLLVATLLSAQCTDKRINQITHRTVSPLPHSQSHGRSNMGRHLRAD